VSLAFRSSSEETRIPWSNFAAAAGLLLLWQGIVQFVYSGNGTIPTPLEIARQFADDGPGLYFASAIPTLRGAALGWLWGNGAAIILAVAAVLVPRLARPILQLGVVSFCLPVVAIGPLLTILFAGDTPRVVLAALAVFFTTLVGSILGLRGADPTALDLVRVFGGRQIDELVKVRMRSALPNLFAALRVASPSAVLGAMVAEFLGAENGLGVLLINSQQALNFSRTWAIAIFVTCIAGAAYGLTAMVGQLITPWARETPANLAASVDAVSDRGRRGPFRALGAAFASILLLLMLIAAVWEGLLHAFAISPFIGKGPLDVWEWLVNSETGADNRLQLASEAFVTFRDASIGLIAGSAAAVVIAIAFSVWSGLRRALMGPSLALQSVPLIAVTPIIVLIFGRSLLSIAVIGSMVTFFPTLVNVSLALQRTPRQMMDLMFVFGASRIAQLRKVQLPSALPSLFSSLRVAAPLAVTGAMLAEWLATGQGLGYAMLSASAQSDYDGLWARVVVATLFSLSIYNTIGVAERAVVTYLSEA
jgi:sulfonate transport system permease protein